MHARGRMTIVALVFGFMVASAGWAPVAADLAAHRNPTPPATPGVGVKPVAPIERIQGLPRRPVFSAPTATPTPAPPPSLRVREPALPAAVQVDVVQDVSEPDWPAVL